MEYVLNKISFKEWGCYWLIFEEKEVCIDLLFCLVNNNREVELFENVIYCSSVVIV